MRTNNHKTNVATRSVCRPALAAKIGAAALICVMVRVLLAQAPATPPAPAASGPREDVDARGYKIQVPLEAYMDPKNRTKLQKLKNEVRGFVTSQPSPINDAATKSTVDRFFIQYFFPLMTTEEGLKSIADDRK